MQKHKTLPVSLDSIPCPFHYAAFFSTSGLHAWDSIPSFDKLQAGDLIVYLPPDFQPQEIKSMPEKRTGTHIMMVEQVIEKIENTVKLIIIDCTKLRHTKYDSRPRGKGGLGRSPCSIQHTGSSYLLSWGKRKKKWEKDIYFGRVKTA